MKVYVHYARENWVLDRYANEFNSQELDFITVDPVKADVIWVLSPWAWSNIPLKVLERKKVVVTIHHVVPEKFDYKNFALRDHYVDLYHVPCQKTKDFISKHTNKPIDVLGYWIDLDFWQPADKANARKEIGIPSDSYVIGSFQRDTEGHDLKSPKLEKGPDLFVDYVKRNKRENMYVLLGGWRRQYVRRELEKANISYILMEQVARSKLRMMYAACDLYIVSSRHEGGPQAALEAPAMKVPIVSTNVGIVSEVLPDNCIVDITKSEYIPTEEDVLEAYDNVQKYNLVDHVQKYGMMFWRV